MGVYVSWTKATEDEESFLFRCSHSFVTRFFLALVLYSILFPYFNCCCCCFFRKKREVGGGGGRVSETGERIEIETDKGKIKERKKERKKKKSQSKSS